MAIGHITAIGIRPRDDSIGPSGHHLRWSFPAHLGFPAKGFVVHRRASQPLKPDHCLNLGKTRVPTDQIVAPGSLLEGVSFHYSGSSRLRGNGTDLSVHQPGSDLLELRFASPMACVRIDIEGVQGQIRLRGYAGTSQIASASASPGASRSLQVTAANLSRVTIGLSFNRLTALCHLGMDVVCADGSWGQPIAELPLLDRPDRGLARLEVGLANRYAPDRAAAVHRYEPELKAMIEWLELLQDPTDPRFEATGLTADQLSLASPADNPLRSVRPQGILMLASLDPNIARLLGLYWVDAYGTGQGPERDKPYDYKIVGQWRDAGAGCGLILGLGAGKAALPSVDKPLEGNQLAGLHWRDKRPLGRVGLRWPRPKQGQGPVQPVLFDLSRHTGGRARSLTEDKPVLVPATAWEDKDTALFVDPSAPLGEHEYELQPIDLFGQVGGAVRSDGILVEDLAAPPPPVRLRADLRQPGLPWRTESQRTAARQPATLDLEFEYGDTQHRQAPDAKSFRLHWRRQDLFDSKPVTAELVDSRVLPDGRRVNTVRLQSIDGSGIDLAAYDGGRLSRASQTETPLPARERHHFRLATLLPPDRAELQPGEITLESGRYRLTSDPKLRRNWVRIAAAVPVRAPLRGMLKAMGPLHAAAISVQVPAAQPDPLRHMPAAHRPEQTPAPPAIVEIEIDRKLLEPGLLAGGTLQTAGRSYPILYSGSGGDRPTRIAVPAGADVSVGSELKLIPATTLAPAPTIQQIDRLADDRLLVTLPRLGNPAGVSFLAGGSALIDGHLHSIDEAAEDESHLRLRLRSHVPTSEAWAGWQGMSVEVTPPIVQCLTLQATAASLATAPAGGELAFDIQNGQRIDAHIARVVSDVRASAGDVNMVVRLSIAASRALQAGTTICRYHAPYRRTLHVKIPGTTGVTDAGITIDLSSASPPGSQTIYLAVTATDEREREGPLSSPTQVMAVALPPSGAPGQPYPCALGALAAAGHATPPDRRGRATLCLAWGTGTLSPASGLRYEVARALDSGILAAHRRNWLLGGPPLQAGNSIVASLSAVTLDAKSGLYRASMTADLAGRSPQAFRGGRILQGDRCFQITGIAAGSAATLDVMLRSASTDGPIDDVGTLEPLADYEMMRNDTGELRRLAKANEEAFSLVTGMPIEPTEFRDELPGVGSNQFFYRVRAVDTAGNYSEWSEVSCPFLQVDTTPLRAPTNLRATGAVRSITLRWTLDATAHQYAVHRATSRGELGLLTSRIPLALIEASADNAMPLEATFRDEPLDLPDPGSSYFYCVMAARSVPTGPAPSDRLIIWSIASTIVEACPVDPAPPNPPGDISVQRLAESTAPAVRVRWSASGKSKFLVRRRLVTSPLWETVGSWRDGADLAVEDSALLFEQLDLSPLDESTIYQVLARAPTGRTTSSIESDPI